ncbi:response regulator transcription factor [Gracilibacillus caseinilyticus]|uniref:Response regulator transcription factor n=1 Tax=Gracilibacillus caseinilyticus TaxID=2932256 RepID=A0ABY4EQG8_9BACI|nr:response regulator transcription factor [Gracilibacillus caseinilyticus]UOQ46690.1 response regulator transcription factor [Gracilibacillus caseinilyticus]
MTHILIVEDEEKLARVVELELGYENYQTTTAHDGQTAFQLLQQHTYDLLLLDIMLPGMSGLEILRRYRKTDSMTPILLLTARGEVHDKVSGLDLGANDYITKPFQMEELLARIRAQLRQKVPAQTEDHLLGFDDLTIDLQARDVTRSTQLIELTPREYDLLVFLLQHKNQVLTREQLLEHVWGFDYAGDTNVVDVYIRYLRNKIDKPFQKNTIQTIRGVGYTIKDAKS